MKRKTTFFILTAILFTTFSSYVFLVNKTVANVVTRGKAQASISSISSAMGELEFKYMTLKKSVTLELAYSKGFNDSVPSSFLAQNAFPTPISFNSR